MKKTTITSNVRNALQFEECTKYDEALLLLSVYQQRGLILTPAQKAIFTEMPNPKSILRIADREKKAKQKKQK